MKRTILLITVLLLILLLVILRIWVFDKAKPGTSGTTPVPVIPVDAWIAKDTVVTFEISTIGTMRANESTAIVPEISKKVTGICMTEGAFVVKDQLLFKLDDAEILARLSKLTIEEELAAANESRQKALLEKGGVSQERYDEVLNLLNLIRAEIAILKVDLAKTEIRAPFNGKVGLRNVSPGAMVDPSVILTTIEDVGKMKLDFTVPERYASDIRPGMKVKFTLENSPDSYEAVIEACEPSVDQRTRSLVVRALTDNPGAVFTPGLSVRVTLNTGKSSESLYVPSICLVPSQQGYSVYLFRSGKALLNPIKPGMRSKERVMILEGLHPGDTVVTTNLLKLHKDAAVKIIHLN